MKLSSFSPTARLRAVPLVPSACLWIGKGLIIGQCDLNPLFTRQLLSLVAGKGDLEEKNSIPEKSGLRGKSK